MTKKIRFGSLFAGIGGFDLGFERAGMECAWQVEIDDYATKVLEKHWPKVKRWKDVKTFPPEPIDEWKADIICGGFPCQDISYAGKGKGITGERSGLFFEAIRVVQQLQPKIVVLENVAALLSRGLDVVLGTLAQIGYDAEWHCVEAKECGIPQRGRDRLFLLAHTSGMFCNVGNDNAIRSEKERPILSEPRNSHRQTLPGRCYWQTNHPAILRVADGVPARVDRLKCLGNAVVPQVAEWIGRKVLQGFNDFETEGKLA